MPPFNVQPQPSRIEPDAGDNSLRIYHKSYVPLSNPPQYTEGLSCRLILDCAFTPTGLKGIGIVTRKVPYALGTNIEVGTKVDLDYSNGKTQTCSVKEIRDQ